MLLHALYIKQYGLWWWSLEFPLLFLPANFHVDFGFLCNCCFGHPHLLKLDRIVLGIDQEQDLLSKNIPKGWKILQKHRYKTPQHMDLLIHWTDNPDNPLSINSHPYASGQDPSGHILFWIGEYHYYKY